MPRLITFFIAFFFLHSCFSQNRYSIQPDSVKTISLEIKKVDSSKTVNIKDRRIYELWVYNNSDSTICILFSSEMDGSINKRAFSLDPAYGCSDTLRYFSLEHCKNWDIGYLPFPAKPVLISPYTYLKTFFAIDLASDNPKEFHLHFATIDITYNEIIKSYQNDIHDWDKSLSLKCKQVKLPN